MDYDDAVRYARKLSLQTGLMFVLSGTVMIGLGNYDRIHTYATHSELKSYVAKGFPVSLGTETVYAVNIRILRHFYNGEEI